MANKEHLSLLLQRGLAWYNWRERHPEVQIDLGRANLRKVKLSNIDLSRAILLDADLVQADLSYSTLRQTDLRRANLTWANLESAELRGAYLNETILRHTILDRVRLIAADLRGADLTGARLYDADLTDANLSGANLSEANLMGAELLRANLSGANLSGTNLYFANLSWSILSEANLTEANLTHCRVYATSAWNVQLTNAVQEDLIITRSQKEIDITVDNLEVAQFIYLLLNDTKIRDVIDTITSKVVLILGRFTPERKIVLDALRSELRKKDYLPVVFDFEKPASRDITETISTLAHMARFVIADITQAKSIPQELERIVPGLPSVPVQPLLQARAKEYVMFEHFKRYPWVLEVYRYSTTDHLLATLTKNVVEPAEQKAKELEKR